MSKQIYAPKKKAVRRTYDLQGVRQVLFPSSSPPPPPAPKKNPVKRTYDLQGARKVLFPSSPPPPPPAPRSRRTTARAFHLSARPLVWGVSPELVEAQVLAESGDIREKFLNYSPEDVAEEDDVEWLERLWELYFPAGQPHNKYEEAYLQLMRDVIDSRLDEIRH